MSLNPSNSSEPNKIFAAIFAIIVVLGALRYLGSREEEAIPKDVEAPAVEEPEDIEQPIIVAKEVHVLESPFIPATDPFSQEQYAQAPKIVVSGNFEQVTLYVTGEVIGKGSRFLLLNFHDHSGIINGVRESARRLNVEKTNEGGGLFTAENSISAAVNLLNAKLGSSSAVYERTGSGTFIASLIQEEQKPDVLKILVVPFNKDGSYGGAKITDLRIEYLCKGESVCSIQRCASEKTSTQCLTESLGPQVIREWMQRKGLGS